MKCQNCGKDVASSVKFSPNCGSKLDEELKGPDEVTLDWLRAVAEKIGYKSTPEKTKPTSIFLTHDKMADISFMFKEKAFTVGICAGQRINKPRPRNVVELLTALNKANRGMVIGHWDISDNQDFILCSYSFPLFTQISDRDVMRIIELLSDDVRSFFIAVESVPVMRSVLGM